MEGDGVCTLGRTSNPGGGNHAVLGLVLCGGALGRPIDRAILAVRKTVFEAMDAAREAAIHQAAAQMAPEERDEWSNLHGRYRDRRSVPRTLPPRLTTDAERRRWQNDLAEFAPEGEACREPGPGAYD
jgi:hypothetical protein